MLVAFTAPAWPAAGQAMFNVAGDTASVRVTSLRDMPFRTVVRQQYDYSCGSAALATLLTHHYGRPTTEAAIFQAMFKAGDQAKIQQRGFSLLDMKRYLEANGLKADGYMWTLDDLARADTPSIALIKVATYRHFVIIKGVRDGKVMVGDPAQGLKLYPLAEFGQIWDGLVFLLERDGAGPGAYDHPRDWSHFRLGPMSPLDDTALASFTRELPPIYQVVAFRTGGGAIR
jgi:predicted double-glycine peptidase